MKHIDPLLQAHLAALIANMGYELWGCELQAEGHNMILRIYLDKVEGVTIDDCSFVSHQVSAMLDVEDPFSGRYTLEVSSPGINRPLFELAQYQKYKGETVKIRLREALNGRKQYKGTIISANEDGICLSMEKNAQLLTIPFALIEKGNIVGFDAKVPRKTRIPRKTRVRGH